MRWTEKFSPVALLRGLDYWFTPRYYHPLDFTMNANDDTTSNYGRRLQIALTACPSPPSVSLAKAPRTGSSIELWLICYSSNCFQSMKKSSAATAASVLIFNRWNKYVASCDRQTCPIKACCATCCGLILTRTPWGGGRTIAELVSHSELR